MTWNRIKKLRALAASTPEAPERESALAKAVKLEAKLNEPEPPKPEPDPRVNTQHDCPDGCGGGPDCFHRVFAWASQTPNKVRSLT